MKSVPAIRQVSLSFSNYFERFTNICPQNDEKRDIAPNAFKCPQMHVESISMRKKRKKTSFWIFRFSAQLPIYFKLKPVCAVFGTNFGAL